MKTKILIILIAFLSLFPNIGEAQTTLTLPPDTLRIEDVDVKLFYPYKGGEVELHIGPRGGIFFLYIRKDGEEGKRYVRKDDPKIIRQSIKQTNHEK